MDFEKFIEKINSDKTYKSAVKEILSNNPCVLHDAPEYLRNDKELVLFASRYDRLVGEHISSELKKTKIF